MIRPLLFSILLMLAFAACRGQEEVPESSSTGSTSSSPTPMPTTPALPTPTPAALPNPSAQLAYIGADGALWVVTPDGADNSRLTDRCPGNQIEWSPDGAFIACAYFSIAIFDSAGREVWRRDHSYDVPGAMLLEWSPDSRRLAFRDSDAAIHVIDVIEGTDRLVWPNAVPLGWFGADSLLAGFNAEFGDPGLVYEAHVLDVDTGAESRASYFDNKRFWLSPEGERAVVLSGTGSEGVGLAIYDVAAGIESPIPSVGLTHPSEGIPNRSIAFSKDGERFFAASAEAGRPTVIYSCSMDASGCVVLGSVPGLLLTISDKGLVAYLAPGGIPEMMSIADLNRGTTAIVGPAHPNFSWRPTQ